MKTSDAHILMIPGWSGSGPDHWQSRWANKLSTAKLLDQHEWISPTKSEWVETIVKATNTATKPVVLIAHSLGVITVAHAAPQFNGKKVKGAFLVAPADVDNDGKWPITEGKTFAKEASGFQPIPNQPFNFRTVVVGSQNDPYCSFERARQFADQWGAEFTDAGEAGHINIGSGHGPWPEGLLRFAGFIKKL